MSHIATNRLITVIFAARDLFGHWIATRREDRRARRDADILANMPAERLADMGIPSTTAANRRTSGENGAAPRADLW